MTSKVSFWCPDGANRKRQFVDAMEAIAKEFDVVEYHIHKANEDGKCDMSPTPVLDKCWTFTADGGKHEPGLD